MKTIILFLLLAATLFVVSCTKPSDPETFVTATGNFITPSGNTGKWTYVKTNSTGKRYFQIYYNQPGHKKATFSFNVNGNVEAVTIEKDLQVASLLITDSDTNEANITLTNIQEF